jgi:hypothetical protein
MGIVQLNYRCARQLRVDNFQKSAFAKNIIAIFVALGAQRAGVTGRPRAAAGQLQAVSITPPSPAPTVVTAARLPVSDTEAHRGYKKTFCQWSFSPVTRSDSELSLAGLKFGTAAGRLRNLNSS